jgi:hypothetical protein
VTTPDRDAFGELLDRHGATPERWPADAREPALELLREDRDARADWECALDLEGALDDWTVPEPADDLALRIAAAAPERGRLGEVPALPGLRLWQGALLATIPVLIGFLIAVVQVDAPAPRAASAPVQAAEVELGLLSTYGLLEPASGDAP